MNLRKNFRMNLLNLPFTSFVAKNVILDANLAKLYRVQTKALNQAVKRNLKRFPKDFMFQLDESDLEFLRSQIVTSSLSFDKEHGGRRYSPYAFTEQGVVMLSSVLRSPQAIAINIEIMRMFIKMRRVIASTEKLSKELKEVKSFLLKNSQEGTVEFKKVWRAIEALTPASEPERKIGFRLNGYTN